MVGKLLGGWVAKGYQSVQLKGTKLRGMIFEDCEDEGNSRSGCLPDVLAGIEDIKGKRAKRAWNH